MKRLATITILLLLGLSNLVHAEDSEYKNEAVESAEVVLATIGEDGSFEVLGEPIAVNPDGSFDADLPEGFPDHKPVFVVAQDPSGEGIPQISMMKTDGGEVTIDPTTTAIANTFVSFINSAEGIDPSSTDVTQVSQFFEKIETALEEVPVADTASATVDRMAQALSLQPNIFLEAVDGTFTVNPEDVIKVASLIDEAASPEGFNPLNGKPPELPSEIPPGSTAAGLLPPELVAKMAPKGFDFNKTFGDQIPPPGAFQFLDEKGKPAPMPAGSFMMPSVTANPNVKFPEKAMFPPGVTIPEGFHMPPNAQLSPGTVLAEGFAPPPGLSIPPGIVAPQGFDPSKFGAIQKAEFTAPAGFAPPPGFALADSKGGFMMPPGFALPAGTSVPTGAMQMPPPPGFKEGMMPPPPPGSVQTNSTQVPPPPQGFAFAAGASLPAGFNPASFGIQPPPGFTAKMPPPVADFAQFKGDNFIPFDPFGGTFKPPVDGAAPFIPPSISAGGTFDPNAAFQPVPPPVGQPGPNGGQGPQGSANPGQAGDKGPQGPANPPTTGSQQPSQPSGNGGDKGPQGPAIPPTTGSQQPSQPSSGGSTNPPPSSGGTVAPPPANNPAPSSGGTVAPPPAANNPPPPPPANNPPPPPPANNPPPPPPARVKFSVKPSLVKGRKVTVLSEQGLKAGTRTDLTLTTKAKARKVIASQGVYAIGKAKAGATSTLLSLIVDPSISSDAAKITISEVDNTVEVTDFALEKDATQLITQLNGSKIEMTTAGADIEDFDFTSIVGYLLAPGTSTGTLKTAITVKGKLSEGTSGQIISFTKPKKPLADGVYTVVFENGEDVYFGKLTIGTLKTRTVSGKVLAPGGKL